MQSVLIDAQFVAQEQRSLPMQSKERANPIRKFPQGLIHPAHGETYTGMAKGKSMRLQPRKRGAGFSPHQREMAAEAMEYSDARDGFTLKRHKCRAPSRRPAAATLKNPRP